MIQYWNNHAFNRTEPKYWLIPGNATQHDSILK